MASKRRNVQHSCRRRLLGTLGALTLAGCGGSGDVGPCTLSSSGGLGSLSCIVTPSATDGPYFVDAGLNRSDVTTASVTSGRTLLLHFKVRAGTFEFTSQCFFDEDITDLVYCAAPYNNGGRNNNDGIYTASLVLTLMRDAADGGYVRVFTIGLQL